MVKSTQEGIIVESVLGLGQGNIINGDFSVNVALGYKIEKGEVTLADGRLYLYSEDGDVLYATPDLLSVHSVAGGHRNFKLPRQAKVVYDLFKGAVVARDATEFEVELPPASTALFFTGDEALLYPLLKNRQEDQ